MNAKPRAAPDALPAAGARDPLARAPHRAAACRRSSILSFSETVAPRVYAFGFGNYLEFFTEPLYWRTLLRTAFMSILVTALTLVLAFPDRATTSPGGAGPR